MRHLVLVLLMCVMASMGAVAKSFFMLTPTVTKNHLKFKQTSDNTWLMYVPATYPCPGAGNNLYKGFQFIVGDDEGYLYRPQTSGQMVNGEDGSNSGTLTKSSAKRASWDSWDYSAACLAVKKDVPQSERKNPYWGMTSKDLVMDGCLVFTITLGEDGNLTYTAGLDDERRVAYAACNTVEGSDNGTYWSAAYTTFLFASKLTDGTFSPYYKGKVVVDNIPSENNNQVRHNGLWFYTPIQEKYEAADAAGNKDDWWYEVKNDLGTRGISSDGVNLFQNGGNFESPMYGSFNVSTTFYYGGNNQGKMEKKFAKSYDQPLVGSNRTYCNNEKDMKNRYNVHSYIAVGYKSSDKGADDQDAFVLKEVPYIPKGVGVLLYSPDATADTLGPKEEYTGEKTYNYRQENYLIPVFEKTALHTYSYEGSQKYINFFLGQLYDTRTWKNGTYYQSQNVPEGTTVSDYWGFFSAIDGSYCSANRAYLSYPANDELTRWIEDKGGQAGAKCSLGFSEGETTGVTRVPAAKTVQDDAYYTLDGRKVLKPTHGIYIHNGKTYLYK